MPQFIPAGEGKCPNCNRDCPIYLVRTPEANDAVTADCPLDGWVDIK